LNLNLLLFLIANDILRPLLVSTIQKPHDQKSNFIGKQSWLLLKFVYSNSLYKTKHTQLLWWWQERSTFFNLNIPSNPKDLFQISIIYALNIALSLISYQILGAYFKPLFILSILYSIMSQEVAYKCTKKTLKWILEHHLDFFNLMLLNITITYNTIDCQCYKIFHQ